MFKGLINRIFGERPINGEMDGNVIDQDESREVDLNEELQGIRRVLQQSGSISRIVELLNNANYSSEDLNSLVLGIRNEYIPEELESTIRILRWDGKIIAQKGTVVSKYKISIPLGTMTGEYALEVVVTRKPKIDDKFRILWIGLDYAGKTTLLHKLRYNEFIQPNRTVGQELENVILEGLKITNIDLGGQKALRQHWSRFPLTPQIIVFVIDILDDDRFDEAYDELETHVTENDKYDSIPILILINKIDEFNGSKDPIAYVTENIDLLSLLNDRSWQLHAVSALTGEGLENAIDTMSKLLLDTETQ